MGVLTRPARHSGSGHLEPLRLAVVGAGWYGCHIASELIRDGHDVHVFEAKPEIFVGASGYTQNRLHQGFHYPRSSQTRKQSITGFNQFKATYPFLGRPIADNIYAVAAVDSLLDAETYTQIIAASGLEYEDVEPDAFHLENVSAALRVGEELLLTAGAKDYFAELLRPYLRLGDPVVELKDSGCEVFANGESFDAAIDCTWGASTALGESPWTDLYFEPCVTLLYDSEPPVRDLALTVVDGPFFSVYPYDDEHCTLTSVTHTPLGRHGSYEQAVATISRQDGASLTAVRTAMERQVVDYWPGFHDHFRYSDASCSVKTKMRSGSDARIASIRRTGRQIYVFAGKVNTIFMATSEVRRQLAAIRREILR
ncbi:MAG: NAD(P)/FAD-dependent oxidoreductase [Actinobacteria bacterium]|nr:NAD(P)/FAD-dependent oxidoreductase [Actinomycetota bacterium]